MGSKEESRSGLGARTLAVVIARCGAEHRTVHSGGLDPALAVDVHALRPRSRFELRTRATRECSATAEALYRQLALIEDLGPERVLVIESDAIRGIDYPALIEAHAASGLGATLAYAEVPTGAPGGFGDVTLDGVGRVLRIDDEAARKPAAANADPRLVCAGAYIVDRELLIDSLEVDAADSTSTHDFRRDVLPLLIRANGVAAYRACAGQGLADCGARTRRHVQRPRLNTAPHCEHLTGECCFRSLRCGS